MRRALVSIALLFQSACWIPEISLLDGGQGTPADAGEADAGATDAGRVLADAAPGDPCIGWLLVGELDACPIPQVARIDRFALEPGRYDYDTDKAILRRDQGEEIRHESLVLGEGDRAVRVVSAGAIDLPEGVTLRATGTLPLILLSWGDMDVSGLVDVSSANIVPFGRGAGANPILCEGPLFVAGGGGNGFTVGGGGGGGGALRSAGGAGGLSNSGNGGGRGGLSATPPVPFRGGCPGGSGGAGEADATPPGDGGGAIALIARDDLRIDGQILAGGAGGTGGFTFNGAGGGGGGSGGTIWLEADTIAMGELALLFAGGGGGGEGASDELTGTEGIGADGTDAIPGAVAQGGSTDTNPGGDGGDGSSSKAGPGQAGQEGPGVTGGGGGGGGSGIIVFRQSADAVLRQRETGPSGLIGPPLPLPTDAVPDALH